ncbi:hypothetical protein AAF712_001004 [Marasmius tenuissimus]|uniref:Ribosome biogenesis protein SLX9 n=1 Tax=Marasmius tenuissimus TaxID=585030 RepID=A0ABR3ADR6_9AGAR
MPKDRTKRTAGHAPSVKLAKRQFAAPDGQKIERVEIGSSVDASADDLLGQSTAKEMQGLKKQDKQALKREALLQRSLREYVSLQNLTLSPYSKSHMRRMKRKAREQLASGLDDIQSALNSLDDNATNPSNTTESSTETGYDEAAQTGQPPPKTKPGQIGEGKGATLSKQQRKRVLQAERMRHPLILQNPQFSSNPFQTIRTHAQNTLVKHEPSKS